MSIDPAPSTAPASQPRPTHTGGERPEHRRARNQVPLIFKLLDQLDSEDLSPEQRIRALRHLERPLLQLASGLPRPMRAAGDGVAELALAPTVAQRLFGRVCRNLDNILLALDKRRFQPGCEHDDQRCWTIRRLFKFLGYQVDYAVIWGQPVPEGTWQRLHDLFGYLLHRGDVRPGEAPGQPAAGFDPELLYKRLLLLGLIPGLAGRVNADHLAELPAWAGRTRLCDPAGHLGEYGLIAVETSRDAPAAYRSAPPEDPWRGWVLKVPADFRAAMGLTSPVLTLSPTEPTSPPSFLPPGRRLAG
jgi:hypothetical protein